MTHTFATLQVSAEAYDEIAGKLKSAGYDHAFVDDVIDMHGIGLVRGEAATGSISILFDRGRGPNLEFVEIEDDKGRSVRVGTWRMREDQDLVELCLPAPAVRDQKERIQELLEANNREVEVRRRTLGDMRDLLQVLNGTREMHANQMRRMFENAAVEADRLRDARKQIDDLTRRLEMVQHALDRVREYASDFPNLDACTAIIETVDDALAERAQGWQASQALSRKALWAFACETMRTACADEVGRHDKTGRQWVPGSFWDKVTQEAVARIRSLPIPAMGEG